MTGYLQRSMARKEWRTLRQRTLLAFRSPLLILLILPILYLSTLARTLVLGDPTEYTLVAQILGIAHPPGYAFMTLVGKLFQTLIPFGTIPWRTHLLSATAATLAALFVYGIIRLVARGRDSYVAALFAALTVGTAVDYWQHAIHANPHIITATFLAANLFFLTRWAAVSAETPGNGDAGKRWLYAFCVSAGLGITHHPLTVFAFPAYGLFVLLVRPSIWREWRTLLKMAGAALLGLSLWLYFPIRSPMAPPLAPTTMNTLDGFLTHVLARGLSESLPYYPLAAQPDRALVFWTLLRLQYALPVIFLALAGSGWLLGGAKTGAPGPPRPSPRHFFALYGLAFLGNYAFVISLKAQDIMAYLLGPFLVVGLLAGMGLYALLALTRQVLKLHNRAVVLLAAALFLLGPVLQVARNAPHISLRHYSEGQAYVKAVFSYFAGKNEEAILLNDWEHMTPLWYTRYVEGRWPDTADVQPEFVSTQRPWLESVMAWLPSGRPVYLSNYRREVADFGFRLRPAGPFYRVIDQDERTMPPAGLTPVAAAGGDIEITGYSLPQAQVTAGEYVPFILAMRAPQGTADFYVPVLQVGDITFTFTTDSHLVTPVWEPGEIIVERFDFALPHDLAGGAYPITLNLKNLSADERMGLNLSLGQLQVTAQEYPVATGHLLANFRQRVGLVSAVGKGNGRRTAPWHNNPLGARPGDTIHLTLRWQSLAPAEESYTVFVHLIDTANRPIVDNLDYTPLGGAFPTHLWIPKWLPGQQVLDPYRLQIPPDQPPGTYHIEVGLYEMVSKRRLHISDQDGNLIGDRYILGDIIVEPGTSAN